MLATIETITSATSQFEAQCEVVHRNQRRIRLKVPRLGFDTKYAGELKYLVESLDYVQDVRINRAASSIAVEYDYNASVEAIASSQQQLFVALSQAIHVDIEDSKAPARESTPASSQDIDFWERLGLPALPLTLSWDNLGTFALSIKNVVLIVVGTVSLVIGIVGIILPLVPGLPFLLLAGACFNSLELNSQTSN